MINYFGNDFTSDKYDSIALSAISDKFLKNESALFSTKWFSYRHLHPVSATYLFAHLYTEEYRKVYQKIRDQDRGKIAPAFINPAIKREQKEWKLIQKDRSATRKALTELSNSQLTGEQKIELQEMKDDFRQKVRDENEEIDFNARNRQPTDPMKLQETLGLWKARQVADEIGMPYDLYIGAIMRFLIQGNIWQRIPRPVHLYSNKVKEFIAEEWVNMLNTSVIEPEISHLSDDNDFSIQCKQDIARWLCEQLKTRKSPHFGLSHFIYEIKLIPEEIALLYYSSETIEKAAKFYNE